MRRALVVFCLIFGSAAVPVSTALSAAATAPSPDVSLHVANRQVTVGRSPSFGYHAYNLKSGSKVALQRRVSGQWKIVAHTGAHAGSFSGTLTAPKLTTLGIAYYRAAIYRNGHQGVTSGTRSIVGFGSVTMKALCNGVLDGYCIHEVHHLNGGSTFTSEMATGVNEPDDPWSAEIAGGTTSCRSITFRYISDSQDSTSTYLELRQKGLKAQKHVNSSMNVGKFTAELTGNAFGMSVVQDSAQVFMYFNGAASCYSATGKK